MLEMSPVIVTSSSPGQKNSPSPPCTSASLASHLLAAVSQVQSLSSQLPPSLPLPTSSPQGGALAGGYRPLMGGMHNLQFGSEPPMSSLLAGLKDFPRQYHSPPPIPSTESHECKIVEYRNAKVAAFIIQGETMLCLPQAFELFLKHLVGGLHTVYTKLKRLSIEPLVCNVDQVRILRGLGAIQPGVNRCKLLSMQHFDILYRDCTTASSRPGRPPKRASDFMGMTPQHDSLYDLKKRHLETGAHAGILGLNGSHNPGQGTPNGLFSNGHLGDHRMDKSPLLSNGYPGGPHFNPLQYMAQHMAGFGYPPMLPGAGLPGGLPSGLSSGMPGGHSVPHPISPTDSIGSPAKHHPITPETLTRLHEERLERERQISNDRRGLPPVSVPNSTASILTQDHIQHHNKTTTPYTPLLRPSSVSPTAPISSTNGSTMEDHHGRSQGEDSRECEREHSPVLNLSKVEDVPPVSSDDRDDEQADNRSHDSERGMHPEDENRQSSNEHRDEERLSEMDDDEMDKDESMDIGDGWGRTSTTPGQTNLGPSPIHSMVPPHVMLGAAPLSSTEVLLRNILGLLRVAEENARHHERRSQHEKAELKMEVLREREMRESLEKQLQEEHKNRVLMQKRCAKLKKLRRRLQERLDMEVIQRNRKDNDTIRSTTPDNLSESNYTLRKNIEAITSEFQPESLHPDVLQGMAAAAVAAAKDERMMVPPTLVAATSVGSWR